MRIVFDKPPIFDECVKHFGVKKSDRIWYTYGDTIYAPSGQMPPDDVIAHEEIHAEQQAHDETAAKLWWQRYFIDPDFRVSQEAEGYGQQLKFLCRIYRDRNTQHTILHQFAGFLSGEKYGKPVSYSDAKKLIKSFADGTVLAGIENHIHGDN